MTDEEVKYLFTLPPEDIVKWFRAKGYAFSWNWQDVWQEAHSQAFTVAKVMKLDILQELRDETDKIFSSGITFEQFKKDLEPVLKRLGWWGKVRADQVQGYEPASGVAPDKIVQLGSPARLKTIFTVNSNVSYNSSRYKFQMQNSTERPYWLYNQLERKHKRKAHTVYAGKVFMFDDPIWNKIYPPNGWFCGCWVRALTKKQMDEMGLTVSNGADFAIVTDEGWDYNPGKNFYEPDPAKYDKDIFSQYKKQT